MKRYLPFIIVTVVAAAAIGSGVSLFRAKHGSASQLKSSGVPVENASDSVHMLGPADAAITLEEFGDFQCPPCQKVAESINELQKQYNLRVIFREFPLAMHQHAHDAALAAEAAGRQGKFWPMHDLLYREQEVWSKSSDALTLFNAYAGMLGLDLGRFKKDMESEDVRLQVELDQRRGAMIGVRTTPTIFINNQWVAPSHLNPNGLRTEVDAAVKGTKPSS
jgi:protein-disulfide isomerase